MVTVTKKLLIPTAAAILIMGVFACEKLAGPGDDQADILNALRYLIEQDEAFSTDGLGEDSYQDDEYSSIGKLAVYEPGSYRTDLAKTMGDTLWLRNYLRIRWMRRITAHSWVMTLDTLDGDTAFVTISETLSGTFHAAGVITDSVGSVLLADTISKPFEITAMRRARFTKVSDATDFTRGWRVTGLTAMVGTAGTKVSLDQVTISDSSGAILTIDGDAILNQFYNRENLPALPPTTPVTLEVGIGNLGPEFPVGPGEMVVARRAGRMTQRFTRRHRLNDAGLGSDQTAGDNVYTGVFVTSQVPDQPRPFRFFIGVTDISSVLVSGEAYHTAFVGLPYRIAAGN